MSAIHHAYTLKKGTHVLQETEREHGQQLHVLRNGELRTRACAARGHARLVRLEDLDHLVEQRVPCVLELVRERALDRLVREEGGDRDLVCRGENL